MARNWEVSRDEAEYIVDVLEALTDKIEGPHWRAPYLAQELRDLFGMGPREAPAAPGVPR